MGEKIGYIRVSTVDQNTSRQDFDASFQKVFIDKASGKDKNRPELKAMVEYVRQGDEVHCHSMDRLARNTKDLLDLVDVITKKGATVVFEKENLTFKPNEEANPINKLMLTLIGAIAEFERALILERQREGIIIAKKEHKYKGGKKKLLPVEIEDIKNLVAKKVSPSDIAKKYHVTRQTVYNYVK